MSMDLFPTLIEFAGGLIEGKDIDGISIRDLLLSGEQLPERDLFWSFKNQKAIRRGPWKLVSTAKNDTITNELFNLKTDMSEQYDLSAEEPQLTSELLEELDHWHVDVWDGVITVSN